MQTDSGRQSGNVIAFIIVGIALAALLAGGIYASKQQGRVASRADTVAVNTEDSSKNESEAQEKSEAPKDESSQSQNTQQSQNPAPAAPANNNSNSGSGSASQPQVPHTGPSSIASTGPEDGILPAVTFGLLTIGVISYVRSQRSLRSSALK